VKTSQISILPVSDARSISDSVREKMDNLSEIDGGGADQVPSIEEQSEFDGEPPVNSPSAVPEPSEYKEVDQHGSDEEEQDEDEGLGTFALDLSGSHRISPEPDDNATYAPTPKPKVTIPKVSERA
jgi:hypothetical protein